MARDSGLAYPQRFKNPEIVEDLCRDAWLGRELYHNSPQIQGRVSSTSGALQRLAELIERDISAQHLHTEDALADVLATYRALEADLGGAEQFEYLTNLRKPLLARFIRTDLCSDSQWALLQRNGYQGQRPTKLETGAGWYEDWLSPEMDSFVGNEVEVLDVDSVSGIHLRHEGDGYYFPFFVLATVDEESNGTK